MIRTEMKTEPPSWLKSKPWQLWNANWRHETSREINQKGFCQIEAWKQI